MIIRNPVPQSNPGSTQNYPGTISLRCPGCRQMGTFEGVQNVNDITLHIPKANVQNQTELHYLMQRFCPNKTCRAHVFVVATNGKILASYPPIRLDFDSSSIPPNITKTFEEALTCHANNCFTAAAIMVRKTLEELCENQGATGGNLKERIRSLGIKVTLPAELIEGIDHLRLLGNDAAHLESKHFNNVGQTELEVAIKLTKEVLKGVFQYADLIAELKSLQKPTTSGQIS